MTNALNLIYDIYGPWDSIMLVPISFLLEFIYCSTGVLNFYVLIFSVSALIFLILNLSSSQKLKILLGDTASIALGFILSLIIINIMQITLYLLILPSCMIIYYIHNR